MNGVFCVLRRQFIVSQTNPPPPADSATTAVYEAGGHLAAAANLAAWLIPPWVKCEHWFWLFMVNSCRRGILQKTRCFWKLFYQAVKSSHRPSRPHQIVLGSLGDGQTCRRRQSFHCLVDVRGLRCGDRC